MREELARLVETLRTQRALYERMHAGVQEQARTPLSDAAALLRLVTEHHALGTQAETIQKEAAARLRAVEEDPVGPSPEERRLIQEEVAAVQQALAQLMQAQGAGLERLRTERDEVAQRIQKLNQGRKALAAYASQRPRRAEGPQGT